MTPTRFSKFIIFKHEIRHFSFMIRLAHQKDLNI